MLRDGRRSRPWHADVAQLVAHHLAKVRVAGSNPVVRSDSTVGPPTAGGVAEWLRQGPAKPCTRVRFPPPARAISSVGERFLDTEEVTSSILVSPTSKRPGQEFQAKSWSGPFGFSAHPSTLPEKKTSRRTAQRAFATTATEVGASTLQLRETAWLSSDINLPPASKSSHRVWSCHATRNPYTTD